MFVFEKFRAGNFERFNSKRRAPKSLRDHCLLTLGVCFVSFAAAGPAMADFAKSEVTFLFPTNITVNSLGYNYTEVTASSTPIQGNMGVEIDAGASGRVKNWSGSPYLTVNEPGGVMGKFQANGSSQSYSIPRPKFVDTTYPFNISRQKYESFMLVVCDAQADKLRSQGLSNAEIFGEDREISVRIEGHLEYETSGIQGSPVPPEVQDNSQVPQVLVVCKGDPTPLDPVKPAITSVSLNVTDTGNVGNSCALNLTGSIISKDPYTEVKFRYIDDTGKQSDVKTVLTNAGRMAVFKHVYPVTGGDKKTGKVQMVGQNPPFLSNWEGYEINCLIPVGGYSSVLPPKAFHIEGIATAETVLHKGGICPASAKIYGVLKGQGTVSGAAALFANGQVKALKQYSIEDGETIIVEGDYDLHWPNTNAQQQLVKLEMRVTNKQGDVVDQIEKTEAFVCTKPQTIGGAQGSAGGYSTGKPDPAAKQQVAKPATPGKLIRPAAKVFSILSPKGSIKSGRIQLSGGKKKDKYRLRFLRKTKSGGYKPVGSRQLPKTMTGLKARFPLNALSGSQVWRLEICPSDQAKKRNCKTTNFRLPATKTPALLKKKP